jgi:beta-lactam-binding protein with PASTA domain
VFDLIGKTLQEAKAILEGAGVAYTFETDTSNAKADETRVVRMDSAYHLVCMGFLSTPKEKDND